MLSIIVCFRDIRALEELSANAGQTVGIPYEIVPVDNTLGKYGICEAYNSGARKSRFDLLCFVHEDVTFNTIDWGKKVEEIFADSSIGLLGVAGSCHKPANVSTWWDTEEKNHRVHIVQPQDQRLTKVVVNPDHELLSEVAVLDGVFLVTKKHVWQQFKFDEDNLKGFHFYDVDFSTAVMTKYKVMVTYEVLLTHRSAGSPNTNAWLENALIYHKKWKKQLPVFVTKTNTQEKFLAERAASFNIVLRSRKIGYSIIAIAKYTVRYVRFPYKIMFFIAFVYLLVKERLYGR